MPENPPSSPSSRSRNREKDATDAPSELPVERQEESEVPTQEEIEDEDRKLDENKGNDPLNTQQDLEEGEEEEEGEEDQEDEKEASAPPLPDEELPPPLPNETPPNEDDGWEPVWDANAQAYYFYNRLTGVSQWENPRVPTATLGASPSVEENEDGASTKGKSPVVGGYNPAIHGDYDPTAPYAQLYEPQTQEGVSQLDPTASYEAVGVFNRFTGRWQNESVNAQNYSDENKSRRQMNAFFDVDAAANSHDGRSLRAERSAKKLTRKELKQFKEKRKEKKEEKRRAWLRD